MVFRLICSAPVPVKLASDFNLSAPIFNERAENLGTMLDNAAKMWDSGAFPTEVGEHQNVAIFDTKATNIDNGFGIRVPVQLSVSLYVKCDLYYGPLPVPKISGFKDEMSVKVITNAFHVGLLDPEEIEKDWTKIASESEAPVRPVITIFGQVAWGQDGEQI